MVAKRWTRCLLLLGAVRGAGDAGPGAEAPAQPAVPARCAAGDDALCPQGQNCRTNKPGVDRCSPSSAAECAAGPIVKLVAGCPSFCRY